MSEVSQSDKEKIYSQIEDLESKLLKLKKELEYYTDISNGNIKRIKINCNNLSSEFSVTAQEIKASVNAIKEDVQGTKEELSSQISQTAEGITSRVTEVKEDVDGLKTINETVFEQTADGFKLTGDVAISGKLYDTDFNKGYFEVSSDSSATDFGFYGSNSKEIFKIYDAIDGFTLYGYEHNFLQGSKNGVSPVGIWDFTGATVSGLENINAVAVFG